MLSITGKTKLLGVMGDPVEHSLSPVMHNAAIAQLGVDYLYVPFPVVPAELNRAVSGLAAIGVRGFNLTIPHKQAIIPMLAEISPVAQAVGAVNTVWPTESGWAGTNTDVEGFLAPLKELTQPWSETVAVVLGAGGAGRAVVAGCATLGCDRICVVGRNWEKLQAFERSWQNSPLPAKLEIHPWEQLPLLIPEAGLLVNATPVGMSPHAQRSPLSATAMAKLPPNSIVYDLIYTPNPTQLLRQATDLGLIAIDGLEMLVQQGAAALQLWLSREVPVEVMRQSLRHHLGL
ncbi:shikimate dehydrogenase [Phormidium sp. CCY1219]|uniref:shikimate dehydrogenase n=1 Tax=Phormidium sp. CCY1219 TaxID=2886104 RepID=UPI002D1E5F9F|nr:shikimate dehydrogenase [Phormidium sp. CCY1219]MEB3829993.1 shikimate dehydrogenase [Phormidium sp. CCY1219]